MKKQAATSTDSTKGTNTDDLVCADPAAQRAALDQTRLGNAEVQERLRQQGTGASYGRAPEGADGRPVGPYAAVEGSQDTGISGGAGLLHGDSEQGGKVDILSANAGFGVLGGGDSTRYGMRGDAQVFNAGSGDAGVVGGDFGIAAAGAEATLGGDGASLGAGASVLQGGVRFGENDAERANDTQLRVGAGMGVGASGRLHWTDTDGDGRREYGVGGDVGPLSFDVRSEDPLGALLNPAAQLVGEETGLIGADVNLTDAALAKGSEAWELLVKSQAQEDPNRRAWTPPD